MTSWKKIIKQQNVFLHSSINIQREGTMIVSYLDLWLLRYKYNLLFYSDFNISFIHVYLRKTVHNFQKTCNKNKYIITDHGTTYIIHFSVAL